MDLPAMDLHAAARATHIAAGFGGFALGLAAIALPKFGRRSRGHRLVGRAYAVCMLAMAGLSMPLAVGLGNPILLAIGALTVLAVAGGWRAIRVARAAATPGADRRRLVERHLVWMGSSYIAAWTAFLLTNPIFGGGGRWWHGWAYALGPTVVGTALITLAARRYRRGTTAG